MNLLNIKVSGRYQAVGEIPRIAVIRDRDRALCGSLADQIHTLGIPEIIVCDDTCLETFARVVLPDAPDAGVLLTGLRDAVLGPVEIADLRRHLPGWVIIVIDHAGTAHSAADALAAGADDVLRMPFPAHELVARVALRMRQAGMAEKSVSLETPLIARAQLTPVEADIMRILLSHKGQIVTRNQLSQELDKSEWLYGDRKFDVHITRIRKKLKAAFGDRYLVCTIRSKGYLVQFSDEPEST